MDMNDRALRDIVVGAGRRRQRLPAQDGFDIVVASEVMAIFCLAHVADDLKERLGNIVVGYTRDRKPVTRARPEGPRRDDRAAEGRAEAQPGADAGNNPAFVHGGPFANIAHGCNSVIVATRAR
jgi:formate--tetrahydrofolate ligase